MTAAKKHVCHLASEVAHQVSHLIGLTRVD